MSASTSRTACWRRSPGLTLIYLFWRSRSASQPIRRLVALAAGLVLLQIGLGALVILLEVPIWKAVLHQAVGVLTFTIVTLILWRCARTPRAAPSLEAPMGWHYAALEDRFRRISGVNGALAILDWDTAVMMPRKAAADRGEQLAVLKRISHDLLTHAETGEQLAAADDEADLDLWQQANLREMRRKYSHAHALEPALVEAMARATTSCEMLWREARAKADFAMLAPQLAEVVRLVREEATVTGAALGLSPYDALLDAHQPDLRDADVVPLFDGLAAELPPLLEAVLARQAAAPRAAAAARTLPRRSAEGARPRADGPAGLRLRGRPARREHAPLLRRHARRHPHHHPLPRGRAGLRAHGRPARDRPRPLRGGPARALARPAGRRAARHGRAREPVAADGDAGLPLAGVHGLPRRRTARASSATIPPSRRTTSSALHPRRARLHPGGCRRDDLPAHVILRHRLERQLIAGELEVADLPGAWNEGMRALLGVTPPDDRLGCLQDIHWPVGGFGYFPCYTLGAMLAAQLFRAAQAQVPGLLDAIGQGDFAPLLAWLREKVHGQGAMPRFRELVERASGAPLTAEPFLAHLRERYLRNPIHSVAVATAAGRAHGHEAKSRSLASNSTPSSMQKVAIRTSIGERGVRPEARSER